MQFLRNFLLGLTISLPGLAAAQADRPAELSVELNAADPVGEACRLTFVLRNGLPVDVAQLTVETVLFSKQDQVVLLTLFDFGALPLGRPRVRQFQVPDVSCDDLGMVLVNGVDSCSGDGLDPATCEKAIKVQSRTGIALEG